MLKDEKKVAKVLRNSKRVIWNIDCS
jgi:hypothetical protein